MAKKIVQLTVLPGGSVHYNDGAYLPGESFDCDPAEAARLIDLGVAAPAASSTQSTQSPAWSDEQAALLAQIAAADSEDAVNALCPEDEPADKAFAAALVAAVKARLAELAA